MNTKNKYNMIHALNVGDNWFTMYYIHIMYIQQKIEPVIYITWNGF